MIKIDFTADAAYVYLPGYDDNSKHTGFVFTEFVTDSVNVDINGMDPVGIEVIGLQSDIPISRLVTEFGIPDETIRELLSLSNASISAPEETQQ